MINQDEITLLNIHTLSAGTYIPHGIFSKIDPILGHKAGLNRHKETETIPCILSDHCGLKLEFSNNRNNRKPTNS